MIIDKKAKISTECLIRLRSYQVVADIEMTPSSKMVYVVDPQLEERIKIVEF